MVTQPKVLFKRAELLSEFLETIKSKKGSIEIVTSFMQETWQLCQVSFIFLPIHPSTHTFDFYFRSEMTSHIEVYELIY